MCFEPSEYLGRRLSKREKFANIVRNLTSPMRNGLRTRYEKVLFRFLSDKEIERMGRVPCYECGQAHKWY
jgi:hypothetical protein